MGEKRTHKVGKPSHKAVVTGGEGSASSASQSGSPDPGFHFKLMP